VKNLDGLIGETRDPSAEFTLSMAEGPQNDMTTQSGVTWKLTLLHSEGQALDYHWDETLPFDYLTDIDEIEF
jgi:hypothetical protein